MYFQIHGCILACSSKVSAGSYIEVLYTLIYATQVGCYTR